MPKSRRRRRPGRSALRRSRRSRHIISYRRPSSRCAGRWTACLSDRPSRWSTATATPGWISPPGSWSKGTGHRRRWPRRRLSLRYPGTTIWRNSTPRYPEYQFLRHKGYGTKLHYEMLDQYGESPVHRHSFLKATTPKRGKGAPGGTGTKGEQMAADYLTARGCEILGRNWRCPYGEIDLILRQGETLIFAEVKTRSPGMLAAPGRSGDRFQAPQAAGRGRPLSFAKPRCRCSRVLIYWKSIWTGKGIFLKAVWLENAFQTD